MKQLLFLSSILFITIFSSCSEETIPASGIEADKEFYPLTIGNTWIYKSDSVVYSKQFGTIDTLQGFVKEKLTSMAEAADGSDLYLVERSFRRSEDLPWNYTDTYTTSISGKQATRTEENVKQVKLIFPATKGEKWECNQYIDESLSHMVNGESLVIFLNWRSQIISKDATLTVEDVNYDNVLEVLVADSENSIEKRYVKEWYAKDIGLIKKEMIILDTQKIDDSVDFVDRAEKGFILNQTLIDSY